MRLRLPHRRSVLIGCAALTVAAMGVVPAAAAPSAPAAPHTAPVPTADVVRTVALPGGALVRLGADGIAHEIDRSGHETAQRAVPVTPSLALGGDSLTDAQVRALFAPTPDTSAVLATFAPAVGLTGSATAHPTVPGERSAVTSDRAVNAALASVGARTAHALFPQLAPSEAGAVASAAESALAGAAPDLARTVVLDVTGDAAKAAATLRAIPGVTFAEARRAVVGANTGATALPASAVATAATTAAPTAAGAKPGVYGNAALQTSLASYLNAGGVDAVPAWSNLAARTGALPGAGTRITNVSVGDLTDASMKSDPYVGFYGPTTVVNGGQRYLDLPSMPLIPTYTASGSGTLDPLGSTTGQDPVLGEVLLDFGVMAPLPHGSQRAGAKGAGATDLLGIAPGASYRLVVPQVPTNDQIAVALVAAARQTPKPDVITASLGFGTDTEGYPGRYLEDDPVLQATIAAIVHRYGIVVTISANDGTRLYTPTSVGPDGGSPPTDRTTDPAASTSLDDVAESTTPSKVLDSGATAVGATTLDDTLAAPLGPNGRGATDGTYATTRTDGSAAYSSGFGSRIDLSAPGDGIAVFEHTQGGGAKAVTPVLEGGTSASAPMVAATSALVIQAGRLVGRSYTPDQVRSLLTRTAHAVTTPPQADRTLQVGPQIDAGAAVASVLSGSGPTPSPAIVRVSLAHRVTQAAIGGSFTEATDPGRIDLQTTSGEGLVGPVTFGLDVTGLTPGRAATYRLTVGAKTWSSSRPAIRITPTELLTAAGLPVVADSDRTVTYRLTVAQGNKQASVQRTVVVGPTDGTYAEGLAPLTAPTIAEGSGTSVTWDLRGAQVVTHPMIVVSHVGHWNPATGPVFSPAYRVPLKGSHGTVQVPASAFTGGGGVYGIGIAQQTEGTDDWAYDIYAEFTPVRVVGSDATQRPTAPLLDGGHTTTVTRTASTYRLTWNVGAVAGATGATYEISAAGPTLYNALNTVTNQNGTKLDQDGVNAGSVAHGTVSGRSGSIRLDAASLGLDAVTYNVRVFATAGDGSLLGQASPTSSLVVAGVGVPGGGSITDFAVAGADSLAVMRPAGATGSSVVRFDATTETTGATLTSEPAADGGFQLVGVDPGLHRAVLLHYTGGGKQLAVETWATDTGRLVRRVTYASAKTLVLGGVVDGARHRAVLLAQDGTAGGADLALTVSLPTGVIAAPVALDTEGVPAASYDRVDVDPDTGDVLFEQLRAGGICFAFGAAPLARLDPATGTVTPGSGVKCSVAAAVAAGHQQLLEFTYRSFSLNTAGQSLLVSIDLTALQQQGDPVTARVETPRTLAVDGPAGVVLEGYPYPLGHPRFGSAAGIQTDNNATAQFDVAPLGALGSPTATLRGFGFGAPLGEWDNATTRRVQLDPSTHTGWTLSLDGSQVQRFSYPVG